jgi:hypothetical protein
VMFVQLPANFDFARCVGVGRGERVELKTPTIDSLFSLLHALLAAPSRRSGQGASDRRPYVNLPINRNRARSRPAGRRPWVFPAH